jgi:hypothetical protein
VRILLQIASRIVGVFVVACPLAGLHRLVDDAENEAIAKLDHKQLIAFLREGHSASFLGAFVQSLCVLLVLVGAIELVAFLIRFVAGPFVNPKPVCDPKPEWATYGGD